MFWVTHSWANSCIVGPWMWWWLCPQTGKRLIFTATLLLCVVVITWTEEDNWEWRRPKGSRRFIWPNKTAQISRYCHCMTDWCFDRFIGLFLPVENWKDWISQWKYGNEMWHFQREMNPTPYQRTWPFVTYLIIYPFLGLCQNTAWRWQWPFHSAFLHKPWRNEQSENSCCREQ